MKKRYFDKIIKRFGEWNIVESNDGGMFRGELNLTNRERITTNSYTSIIEVEQDINGRAELDIGNWDENYSDLGDPYNF